MTNVFLVFWFIFALLLLRETRIVRLIIYFAVFSAFSFICFLLFSAPDIALAEIVVSVFSTVIFITSFEKHYSFADQAATDNKKKEGIARYIFPVFFSGLLFALFIRFIPGRSANLLLKEQFISMFRDDIGGQNAVTAIYLGYRLYDTLLETLMLIVSVVAIIHLSLHEGGPGVNSIYNSIRNSQIAVYTIRIICPILVLFSIYLVSHGHISPGSGYQGGVIAASFFICRYLIYGISDTPINRIIRVEKAFFVLIALVVLPFITFLANKVLPEYKLIYLIMINLLIGAKVAIGFFIMFYRFISFEMR
jgi:multicomponent Na+:H+ antiporter subunit B